MLRMREFQVRSKMKIRPELKRRAAAVLAQVRSDFGSQTLKGASAGLVREEAEGVEQLSRYM